MKAIAKILTVIVTLILLVEIKTDNVYGNESIIISTPDELMAIGKNPEYPLDADYILAGDIDMLDKSHSPIGTVAEPFVGTFDGAGYAIKNINLVAGELGCVDASRDKNITGYGVFGVIKNNSDEDRAVISNLSLCNVTISDSKCSDTASGALVAVAYNGIVLKNIALVDIDMKLIASKGKELYGAGSVVGAIWADKDSSIKIKTDLSDIYTSGNITVSGFNCENTVSGVVGCVYNQSISSISRVISMGNIKFGDEAGYGISTSKKFDGNGISDAVDRVYYALEDGRANNKIGNGMAKGVLASGKVALSDSWQQALGIMPVPKQALGLVDLGARIHPSLKRNQTISHVTEDFYVPVSYNEENILWSSTSKYVSIDSATGLADVTINEGKAELVTLTYSYAGKTGKLDITLGEKKDVCFDKSYVKVGDILKVLYAPDNATYKWEILNKNTDTRKTIDNNTSEYIVTENDLESFIYVTVNGKTKLSIYVSSLPVVYIDSDVKFGGIRKTSYYNGNIKICGDSEEYATWDLYEGELEFKGRGHSSSYYEKLGLKLKLADKSDMYGVSGYENKHWVLVSNVLDGSFMRNSIINRFITALDASSIMKHTDVILIYNGDYKGVYQLSEHVRIDEGRVDIFDYDEYAENVADIIASEMVKNGELSAHYKKSYVKELANIMENDYGYLDKGYVEDSNGHKHELMSYGIELPSQTGGYLVCMDRHSIDNGYKQATLHTAYTLPFYIDKPDTDAKSQLTSFKSTELYNYAKKYNQTLEYALHSDDFFFRNKDTHYTVVNEGSNERGKWTGTVYTEIAYKDNDRDGMHYSELIDIDSLVQYFLVCEFSQNYDSTKNSFYYQKDIGKLGVVAPFWDFDWSMGNWITIRYTNMPTKWQTTLDGANELFYQHVSWNRMLIRDPYFLLKVWERYKTVRDDIEEMVKDGGYVDQQYEKLKNVAMANDLKWGHLDVFRSFEDSYSDLTKYLDKRVVWLDEQFASFDTLVSSLGYYHSSDYLKVDSVNKNDDGTVTIDAIVTNASVANVAFQVNGTYLVTMEVVDGKASISVPDWALEQDINNIVEVKAMDKDNNYIVNEKYSDTGNYNLIHSNYYVFE